MNLNETVTLFVVEGLHLLISYSNAFQRTIRHLQGVHYINVRYSDPPNGYKHSPVA